MPKEAGEKFYNRADAHSGPHMLTNKATAAHISALMLEIGSKLDASVALVQETCPESEFKEYRRVVGKLMGSLLLDVMNPLYQEHPELKPQELG